MLEILYIATAAKSWNKQKKGLYLMQKQNYVTSYVTNWYKCFLKSD